VHWVHFAGALPGSPFSLICISWGKEGSSPLNSAGAGESRKRGIWLLWMHN
jgi:hypothetical protein